MAVIAKTLKNGTVIYCIDYYDPKGRRRMEHVGPDREKAERRYRTRLDQIEEGTWVDPRLQKRKEKENAETEEKRRILFKDFCWGKFNDWHISKLRRPTKPHVHMRILCAEFGEKHLDEIVAEDVARFQMKRLDTVSKRTGRRLSKTSVNADIRILRILFNKAVEWEHIEKSPLRVQLFKEKPRDVVLEPDDLKRLMQEAREPLRTAIKIAAETGMRRGEIFSLRWKDVSFKKGFIFLRETKNGEDREVPLTATLTALLRADWLEPSRLRNTFVFIGSQGRKPEDDKPIQELRGSWRTACKAAGIDPNTHFHDLRHTWATRLIEGGVPPQVVMACGGWKSVSMLMRYTKISKEKKIEAAEVASAIFNHSDSDSDFVGIEEGTGPRR
jgi:integrase